ncbi:hypothetical protein [Mesobacterium pallidum]|uniref:hypothetical protein n=1 Tax=Mesobacterium pallidum TaxID=2872037 RepID=UPI001EE26652|nr:hypothetical protein [Mesobacterium pallidum]
MTPPKPAEKALGLVLVLLTGGVILDEWGVPGLSVPLAVLTLLLVGLLWPGNRTGRRAFVVVGAVLTLLLAMTTPGWGAIVMRGFGASAFIAAFFAALASLRAVAQTSPGIGAAGTFLSRQPPGRRYLALTAGGHLFALVLNYGAIALLGSLSTAAAAKEPDAQIRQIRTRRMLLAIQRGFLSSLTWSPLGFAMVITTSLVPGASWASAMPYGLVSMVLFAGSGWALDTIFRPKVQNRPAYTRPEGNWWLLQPLFILLAVLGTLAFTLHELTGVRIVGIVTLVVPLIAFIWLVIQLRGIPDAAPLGERVQAYLFADLPNYRAELILLVMAGYIGTVGAPLLEPLVHGLGIDPAALPAGVVLVGFIWLMPLMGLLGANPILAVTLLAPLIPTPEQLGIAPAALVTAIVGGWAISGVLSPFTATVLLIANFGQVKALDVGFRWNLGFILCVGTLLSLWVLLLAWLA